MYDKIHYKLKKKKLKKKKLKKKDEDYDREIEPQEKKVKSFDFI